MSRLSVSDLMVTHLAADQWWSKVAKPKYLKAIDFTIGLLRRLKAQGKQLPGASFDEAINRIIAMRKAVQGGFRLDSLLQNKKLLSGRGTAILSKLEQQEAKLLPSEKDLASFVKTFPDKTNQAVEKQARMLIGIISKAMKVPEAAVERKVLGDQDFMMQSFAACMPVFSKAYSTVVSKMGSAVPGGFEHRIKQAKSSWGKQGSAGPFYTFKDIIGARGVTSSVADMAAATVTIQKDFKPVAKKNYYLQNKGYNAINYNLVEVGTGMVFEFQLKTDVNRVEAALSHDLIYAKEKAIVQLSDEEKKLVGLVIDVSTQLSMKEWAEAFEIPMRMAHLNGAW